jgi:hypothetical protein
MTVGNGLFNSLRNKKRRIIVFFDLKQPPTIGLKWRVEIFGDSFFTFHFWASSQNALFLVSRGTPFFCVLHPFFGPRHRTHYFLPPAGVIFSCFIFVFYAFFFRTFGHFCFFLLHTLTYSRTLLSPLYKQKIIFLLIYLRPQTAPNDRAEMACQNQKGRKATRS